MVAFQSFSQVLRTLGGGRGSSKFDEGEGGLSQYMRGAWEA